MTYRLAGFNSSLVGHEKGKKEKKKGRKKKEKKRGKMNKKKKEKKESLSTRRIFCRLCEPRFSNKLFENPLDPRENNRQVVCKRKKKEGKNRYTHTYTYI